MICTRLFAVGLLTALPAVGWSYDSAFTLTFEEASEAEGFTDLANGPGNNILVAGERVSADNPPYNPRPENAPNFNGTDWLRVGAATQGAGVATYPYDGRAGGTTQDTLDFTITVDVFVNPTYEYRNQVALFGRWVAASGNLPFQVFYSRNTPGNPDGFGWRYGGTTAMYNAFTTTTVTSPQWARLKMEWAGSTAVVSVDEQCDGVYEFVSPPLNPTGQTAAGKIGVQRVINDPANASGRPDQFAYFDNLTYVPFSKVSEWSLY